MKRYFIFKLIRKCKTWQYSYKPEEMGWMYNGDVITMIFNITLFPCAMFTEWNLKNHASS